jgi:hypothetical protein
VSSTNIPTAAPPLERQRSLTPSRQGTKLETARSNVAAWWFQSSTGAAATTALQLVVLAASSGVTLRLIQQPYDQRDLSLSARVRDSVLRVITTDDHASAPAAGDSSLAASASTLSVALDGDAGAVTPGEGALTVADPSSDRQPMRPPRAWEGKRRRCAGLRPWARPVPKDRLGHSHFSCPGNESRLEWRFRFRVRARIALSPTTEARETRRAEWGRQDSNLRRLSRRFYRPFPLAARALPRGFVKQNQA